MSRQKSLKEIHSRETGKVSDKWDIYLEIYEKLLEPFRHETISLLEIGIQNGGSLETWTNYFKAAEIIVGCDIDPRCSELQFNDKRINIVTGDATSKDTIKKILDLSSKFDLIIEDGSHRSDDIVKTFVEFFPKLRPGGIYIAEDLHCCYWEEWGGGLSYPYSGMEYFKALCDCLNSNHWNREDVSPIDFINKISERYGASISNKNFLDSILSVQFFDSVCVIKKAEQGQKTRIEHRIIGGKIETVVSGHFQLESTTMPIYKQQAGCLNGLVDYVSKVKMLSEENAKLIAECRALSEHLLGIQNSNSWRLTKPLRFTKNAVKSLYTAIHASTKKFKL